MLVGSLRGRFCQFLDFHQGNLWLSFILWGERIHFANLGFKGLIKIYFMVVRVRRGNMVSCLFQEY